MMPLLPQRFKVIIQTSTMTLYQLNVTLLSSRWLC